MAESTVGWFVVREKYCLLVEKVRLISQANKAHMYRFVLKNTFTKIYIYHFLINIFIKISSQSYALKTASLSKTTLFFSMEGVTSKKKHRRVTSVLVNITTQPSGIQVWNQDCLNRARAKLATDVKLTGL